MIFIPCRSRVNCISVDILTSERRMDGRCPTIDQLPVEELSSVQMSWQQDENSRLQQSLRILIYKSRSFFLWQVIDLHKHSF